MARLLPLVVLLVLATAPSVSAAAAKPTRVPAKWAKAQKLSKAAARKDLDRDGLSTWAEWRSRTNPRKADSDRDGLADGREDRDRDGLTNAFELTARTDPGKADSDGDRRRDGREDADRDGLDHAAEAKYGYAPRKRDSDGDGVRDGDENAGVIRAVAGPVVTVALARGGTLVATLVDESDVACDLSPDPVEEAVEEITGDDELLDEPEFELQLDDEGEETVDETGDEPGDDAPEAEAAQLPEDADCTATLRTGTLVHSATAVRGPAGLQLSVLELLAP